MACLTITILDIFHTFSYERTLLLAVNSFNVTMQFYVTARYIQSLSLLIYAIFIKYNYTISANFLLRLFLSLTIILTFAIIHQVFPDCFNEDQGLSTFKIISEYLIAIILIISCLLYTTNKTNRNNCTKYLFISSLTTAILAQVAVLFAQSPFGFFIFLSHYLQLVFSILLYLALVEGALKDPYRLLNQSFTRSQERLISTGSFLATMVHDLKNPLATIRALCQLGVKKDKNNVNEYYSRIENQVEYLSEMLNKMLNNFKPEQPQKIDPVILINQLVKDIAPLCENQKIEIIFTVNSHKEIWLEANLFKRAIHNLIRNSIQAIERNGKITIEISRHLNFLHLKISDNGPGIPENIQKNIFQPFVGSKCGTGLGLYMVYYTISKIHGGEINLESSPEQGTTFLIKLPFNHNPLIINQASLDNIKL